MEGNSPKFIALVKIGTFLRKSCDIWAVLGASPALREVINNLLSKYSKKRNDYNDYMIVLSKFTKSMLRLHSPKYNLHDAQRYVVYYF